MLIVTPHLDSHQKGASQREIHKPVEFKHRLQRHPAVIQLQLLFEKFVSREIVISKVVLDGGRGETM